MDALGDDSYATMKLMLDTWGARGLCGASGDQPQKSEGGRSIFDKSNWNPILSQNPAAEFGRRSQAEGGGEAIQIDFYRRVLALSWWVLLFLPEHPDYRFMPVSFRFWVWMRGIIVVLFLFLVLGCYDGGGDDGYGDNIDDDYYDVDFVSCTGDDVLTLAAELGFNSILLFVVRFVVIPGCRMCGCVGCGVWPFGQNVRGQYDLDAGPGTAAAFVGQKAAGRKKQAAAKDSQRAALAAKGKKKKKKKK